MSGDQLKEMQAMLKMMGLTEESLGQMIIQGQVNDDPNSAFINHLIQKPPSGGSGGVGPVSDVLSSETGTLNGNGCDPNWAAPKVSVKSNQKARPDLPGRITKTEYRDTDEVFKQKIKLLAKWIKESSNQVVYAGAGMSTAAGINDVASKGKKTEHGNRLNMQPTIAHHIITSLYHKKHIKHVCHQNHDGLC